MYALRGACARRAAAHQCAADRWHDRKSCLGGALRSDVRRHLRPPGRGDRSDRQGAVGGADGDRTEPMARLPTESLEAYDYYLRAEQLAYRADSGSDGRRPGLYDKAISRSDVRRSLLGYARGATDVLAYGFADTLPAPSPASVPMRRRAGRWRSTPALARLLRTGSAPDARRPTRGESHRRARRSPSARTAPRPTSTSRSC